MRYNKQFLEGDWVIGEHGHIGIVVERREISGEPGFVFELYESGVRCEAPASTLKLWRQRDWMILHLGCNGDLRPGCLNLDKRQNGWEFETDLYPFPDQSVMGITISHAIQCVRHGKLREVFKQFARILHPDGLLRITDDETNDPASSRYRKRAPGAMWDTGLEITKELLQSSGMFAWSCRGNDTNFYTDILMINHRAGKDFPYFVEGGIRSK